MQEKVFSNYFSHYVGYVHNMFYILFVEQYWLYYGTEYCDHMADHKNVMATFQSWNWALLELTSH